MRKYTAGVPITITHTQSIVVSPKEFEELGQMFLDRLTLGRWIEGDYVMEEHVTSHRYELRVVGKVDDPKLAICVAAIRLRDLLKAEQK